MTMKALILEEAGEKPRLSLQDAPVPPLGPHDVLVQTAACGMCYHDVAVIEGTLRRGIKPNIILGHEFSGTVAKVGEGVSLLQIGDSVASALTAFCGECQRCLNGQEYRCLHGQGFGHAIDGGFAQFVKAPERSLVPVPKGINLADASILACPIAVALQALDDVAKLKAGETVLVAGAGGGLGIHAVQIASALGARVLAVTTSPEKIELIESSANAEVILADELDFSEILLALTEDQGADVVVNTVGSALFRSCLRSMAQYGRMVLLGEITGGRINVNPAEILFRDATIVGSTGASPRHIVRAAEMVSSGKIKPLISQHFALEDVQLAYNAMRSKQTFGRVILIPPAIS